jgi:thioredoxin 1
MYKEITTLRELRETTSISGKTILVFHAVWCGPCKHYKPIYERVERNDPSVTLVRSDIDKSPELVAHFGIRSVPTTVIVKNGVVEAKNGVVQYNVLMEGLK